MKDVCLCLEKSMENNVIVHSIGVNRREGKYYCDELGDYFNLEREGFTFLELTWSEFNNYINYSVVRENNEPISKEEIEKEAHIYSSHIVFPDKQLLNEKGQKRVVEWATQDFIAGANWHQQKLISCSVIKSSCLLGNKPENCDQFDALGNCEKCQHKNNIQ